MKMLDISISTMMIRFHLMAAIMVTLGFFGFLYAGIVIGMILFLATLMGIKWSQVNPFRHEPREVHWLQRHRQHHPIHH